MDTPKYQYGRHFFEDGPRPVLLVRYPKQFHAFFIDSMFILRRYVLFKEEKYFTEWANSDDDLKVIKHVVRMFKRKSKLTDLNRIIPKTTRQIFKEILELK